MFLLVIKEQVVAGIQKAADASLDEMKEGGDVTPTQNTISGPSHPRQVLTLFLGNVVEKTDEFQLNFRSGHRMESILVTLVDDLQEDLENADMPIWDLHDLSVMVSTIDQGIFLEYLQKWEIWGIVLYCYIP